MNNSLDAVRRGLDRLPRNLVPAAVAAVDAAAAVYRREVRLHAPRGETGALARNVEATPARARGLKVRAEVRVEARDFAHRGEPAAVEFGTARMAAQPFMRPAADTGRVPALRAARDAFAARAADETGG